jgi:hypothetical protein
MSTIRTQSTAYRFSGFAIPRQNWFKLPHEWTDITAAMTSMAELKVVEYVLKHTWGYHEYGLKKQISLNEFRHGRRRKDGTRMDKGTGLSKPSVIAGLKSAGKRGLLVERVDDSDKARVKKFYALKIRAKQVKEPPEPDQDAVSLQEATLLPMRKPGGKTLNAGVKNLYPDVKKVTPRGQESYHRSEKETLERNQEKRPLTAIFKQLPDLNQPKEKADYVAQQILQQLGDKHSARFYRLVACKIPERVIREVLAEIKQDGADKPAALFTYRMQRWGMGRLKQSAGS